MTYLQRSLFLFCAITVLIANISSGQSSYLFEPSLDHPFGLPHIDAPEEILAFAQLIGDHTCTSISKGKNQEWGDPVEMTWRFKYIMNGMAVQDETLKVDGGHSGSIRQYIADSSRWYVHFYSSGNPSTSLPTWEGNVGEKDKITLYRNQKAPNGMDGYYKISFYDITDSTFNWLGEWVTTDESFSFPTWKIECLKNDYLNIDNANNKILSNIKAFSKAYVNADYEAMANAYTSDGKIFPNNTDIIQGRPAIKDRWTIRNGSKILKHVIYPEEIKFIGNHAYDYGYYEGATESIEGKISEWKGKYVIIWKKVGDDWKIYLDIWNSIN